MSNGAGHNRSHNSGHSRKENDIVILIIGPIGAGKSTFINKALGENLLAVGHGLGPCTTEPRSVAINRKLSISKLEGHRLVLVDTPGFDHPDKNDKQILTEIDTWLGKTYPKAKVIIGGVLYIHDIQNKKFRTADRTVLNKIRTRYGKPAVERTILATTNWGPPEPKDAKRREDELSNKHWLTMTNDGAKVYRFLDSEDSAWNIINDLLKRVDPDQNELGSYLMQKVFGLLDILAIRK